MSIDLQRLYEREKKFLNLFVEDEPLPVELFIGKHIAILGKTGAGKSVTNAVLMEEYTMTGIMPCIFDTEGDYYTLKDWRPHKYKIFRSFKVTRRKTIPAERTKTGKLKKKATVETRKEWNYRAFDNVCDTLLGETKDGLPIERKGCIILINKYSKKDRLEIIYQILKRLWEERIRPEGRKEAIALLVDEAHEKIPQSRSAHVPLTILIEDIAKQGRKQGLSLVLSTQRPAEIQKNALAQCEMLIGLKVDEHLDVEAYTLRLPLEATKAETQKRLWKECRYFRPGECYFKYPTNDPEDTGIKVTTIRWRHSRHTTQTPGKEALIEW